MLTLSFLLAPALVLATPAPTATTLSDELQIPGAVFIPGGRTYIGTEQKDLEKMMNENESLRRFARVYDAETPLKKVAVGDFWMATTEVTNEQYREYVRSTGSKPPVEWGGEALNEARTTFLEEQGKARAEARKAGKSYDSQKFDEDKWWAENWQGVEWSMPDEIALRPVVRVNYADALAYAKWAGMRLPTEFEFQRAIRGDKSKDHYPWGPDWSDDDYSATRENKRVRSLQPVGSFPKGSTKDGIHDLLGNAWEWTSSPYVAYDGHKDGKYTFGKGSSKETVEPESNFDANQRVAVGGSYTHEKFVARATTRRASDRSQTTTALGFRTAATPGGAFDVAEAILQTEVRNSLARPSGVDYAPEQVIGMHFWTSKDSADKNAPEGYAVITGYEYMIFVPIEKLEASSEVEVARDSLEAPVHLGFLATNQEFVEPALAPGTYLLAFRGKGKRRASRSDKEAEEGEGAAEEDAVDPLLSQIDISVDNYLFFNAETGELAASGEAKDPKVESGIGGAFEFKDAVEWETINGEQVQKQVKKLALTAWVTTGRRRGFKIQLPLKPVEGVGNKPWRSK